MRGVNNIFILLKAITLIGFFFRSHTRSHFFARRKAESISSDYVVTAITDEMLVGRVRGNASPVKLCRSPDAPIGCNVATPAHES
jgi:hypothetical protein